MAGLPTLREPDAEELRAIARNPVNIRLNKLLLEAFERDARRKQKRLSARRRRGGGKRRAACAR